MKKSPTEIHSLRVKIELKKFLSSLPNTNKFLTELIENSGEFKEWQTKEKAKSDEPKLELF